MFESTFKTLALLITVIFQFQNLISAQECGSRLTESGGIITSPDYEYEGTSEDIECTWFIEAKEGQRVRLTFLDFVVDGSVPGQCDSARLQLHDGATVDAPSLGNVLCGEDGAQEVTSHTRFLTVFFKATSWDFYKFKIEYSFYDAEDNEKYCVQNMCNATITDQPSCNIQSPSYPHGYDANLDCQWMISSTKKGERISLTFDDLKLKYDKRRGRCKGHHVMIYDGQDRSKTLHGPICHYELNKMEGIIISSTGNDMLIVLTSDDEAGGVDEDEEMHYRGFSAQITMKPKFKTYEHTTPPTTTTIATTTTVTTTTTTPEPTATTTTTTTEKTTKKNRNKNKKKTTTTTETPTTTTTVEPIVTTKSSTTSSSTLAKLLTSPTKEATNNNRITSQDDVTTNDNDDETIDMNQAGGPSGFLKYGHYIIAAVVGSCVIALTCLAIYRIRKRRYDGHDLVSTEKI